MLYSQVEEATLHCGDEERDELLYYILAAHPGRTLVFANAVSTARRIAALLHILKLPSAALHAGTCCPPAVLCCTRGTPPCRRRQDAEDSSLNFTTGACYDACALCLPLGSPGIVCSIASCSELKSRMELQFLRCLERLWCRWCRLNKS